jgi:hypothetical protein
MQSNDLSAKGKENEYRSRHFLAPDRRYRTLVDSRISRMGRGQKRTKSRGMSNFRDQRVQAADLQRRLRYSWGELLGFDALLSNSIRPNLLAEVRLKREKRDRSRASKNQNRQQD